MTSIHLEIFSDSQSMSRQAAVLFAQITQGAVAARGRSLSALSGGGTPTALFRLLAQAPYLTSLPWEKMFFFWGDERCVPPDDPESNYNQAQQAFLGQAPVPPENIRRAKGELAPPAAAQDYANQLKEFAEQGLEWPRFDLVLLGLGADGHTASLFPGSSEPAGMATVAVQANYQGRPAQRISLTPAVFNSAREVIFLVSGAEKAAALLATLAGPRDLSNYPAQRIQPSDGRLWFLADRSAASLLPEHIPGVEVQRRLG